jgi:hypothetical protein
MSEDERIGYLREKLGYESRKKGENVHEGASGEFKKGYDRVTVGFGSNVQARNFGRTGDPQADWTCVCGNVNKGRVRYMVAGREICGLCRQERDFVDTERIDLNGNEDTD